MPPQAPTLDALPLPAEGQARFSAAELAALLDLRLEEVLLLILRGALEAHWVGGKPRVRREALRLFLLAIAADLHPGEPFAAGLQRLLNALRADLTADVGAPDPLSELLAGLDAAVSQTLAPIEAALTLAPLRIPARQPCSGEALPLGILNAPPKPKPAGPRKSERRPELKPRPRPPEAPEPTRSSLIVETFKASKAASRDELESGERAHIVIGTSFPKEHRKSGFISTRDADGPEFIFDTTEAFHIDEDRRISELVSELAEERGVDATPAPVLEAPCEPEPMPAWSASTDRATADPFGDDSAYGDPFGGESAYGDAFGPGAAYDDPFTASPVSSFNAPADGLKLDDLDGDVQAYGGMAPEEVEVCAQEVDAGDSDDCDDDFSLMEEADELCLEDSGEADAVSISDLEGGSERFATGAFASVSESAPMAPPTGAPAPLNLSFSQSQAPLPPPPPPLPSPDIEAFSLRSGAVREAAPPSMTLTGSGGKGGLFGNLGGALSGALAPKAASPAPARAAPPAPQAAPELMATREEEPAPEAVLRRARGRRSADKPEPSKSKKRAAPAERVGGRDQKRKEEAPGAAGGGQSGQPKVRQVEVETIERRTTVRHHKQMYVQTNYPLFVIISQHKIKRLVSVLVDQVSSKKAFHIKASNPIVHIRPIIPGCLCIPASTDLDVTERIAEATFHLTPQALGDLDGARVEVLYEGRVVDTIPLTIRATTQGMAKVSGSMAVVTTTFGPTFKALGQSLSDQGAGWFGDVVGLAGSEYGPVLSSAVLGLLTLGLYLYNRPREADPVEAIFDYEAAQEPPGDKLVMAQRVRLVLLSRTRRQKVEVMEAETTIGRAADNLVVLQERSVGDHHARLRFDPDAQRFEVIPHDGEVQVDGVAVEARQTLGREAVLELSGEVALWFYDEREDPRYDQPATRQRILATLVETLGSFSRPIRQAFEDPKNATVRAALAALMLEGILTPRRWRLIARSQQDFA